MTKARCCRECGKDLSGLNRQAVFCSPEHRKAWNNRRMVRGAEMYDLFMALRYEREEATTHNAMTHLSNLARAFRDADNARREGRKSWHLREAIDRLPLGYSTEGDKR